MEKNVRKIGSTIIGLLLVASPVLAETPVETFILNLRATGIQLLLLWLLTLSVVYGVLSHLSIPKSMPVRGLISMVSAFMVLLAAVGTQAVAFVSTLTTSAILIVFGLMITLMFLELAGAKVGGEHLFAQHPTFFGAAIVILAILIFIGAGGLGLINIPSIVFTDPFVAMIFFLLVMVASVWILVKEGGGK